MRRFVPILSVLILLPGACTIPAAARADDEDQMIKWLPSSVNAVAVVRVKQLLNSPIGRQNKWAEEYRQKYNAGTIASPPFLNQVIRGTHIGSYSTEQTRSFTLYDLPKWMSMADIAKHENSIAETVAGCFSVASPRDIYFTQLEPKLLGGLMPANRQDLARWIRWGQENKKPVIGDYLIGALVDKDAAVVIAIDFQDMLTPSDIHRWLTNAPSLKKAKADIPALEKLFEHFRGARVAVTAADKLHVKLILDFTEPLPQSAKQLASAVLDFLVDMGATLENISHGSANVIEESLVLDADLTDTGLRRILSLIQSPSPAAFVMNEGEGAPPAKPTLVSSLRYYRAVVSILNDLQNIYQRGADNYNRTAMWHDTYAKKIDQLPRLGVDPYLINWGGGLSSKLRLLGASLRGTPLEMNRIQNNFNYHVHWTYYTAGVTPYGYIYRPLFAGVDSNADQIRSQLADAVAKGDADRQKIWTMIQDDRTQVRDKMYEIYKVDFDNPPADLTK